jgi:hypothetical protein
MKDVVKTSKARATAGTVRSRRNSSRPPGAPATATLASEVARLQAIVNAAHEGMVSYNRHGVIKSLNPALEKIFGYPGREIIGQNIDLLIPGWKEHLPEADAANLIPLIPAPDAKPLAAGHEMEGRRRDGTLFPLELFLDHLKLPGGLLRVCFVRDLTEPKQADKAMFEGEQRFRTLVTTSPDALFIAHHGQVAFVNSAGLKLFGAASIENILGKKVLDLFHSTSHHTLRQRLATSPADLEMPLVEGKIVRLDGTVREVEVATAPFIDSNGHSTQVTLRDATNRNEARQTLIYFASLVESSEDAIIGETLDGYVTSWNRGAETIFGYHRSEAIHKHISLIIPPERAREESVILDKVRLGESVEHYETVRQCKDGRLIDISVTVSPIRDQHHTIVGAAKIARDITSRRQLEREILEISDREQRRIGYDLHDGLCQHLAGIELKCQVLEQKLAGLSKTEAARAGEISQDVRDAIGQARALARGLSPVTLEADGLISALHELAVIVEKLFKIRCVFDCDEGITMENQAAATHLFRLTQEAVSNAIKHGRATQISLQFKQDADRLYLGISDNGIGLPAKPFKSRGMGLRIMQSRAGMIGGTLTIERNLSGGTAIICSAPRSIQHKLVPKHGNSK